MTGDHISTPTQRWQHHNTTHRESTGVEPDGICHCNPQPDSGPNGECPRCHRLDMRKALV